MNISVNRMNEIQSTINYDKSDGLPDVSAFLMEVKSVAIITIHISQPNKDWNTILEKLNVLWLLIPELGYKIKDELKKQAEEFISDINKVMNIPSGSKDFSDGNGHIVTINRISEADMLKNGSDDYSHVSVSYITNINEKGGDNV